MLVAPEQQSPADGGEVWVTWSSASVLVLLVGRLADGDALRLKRRLSGLVDRDVRELVIDCAGASWLSEAVVHALADVARLVDTDGAPDALTAPSVGSMTVRGDLGADLVVTELARLTVGGTMTGSDLRASGNVGTVRAGAMRDSRVFAGVRDGVTTMPDSADDFATAASIKGVTVSGRTPGAFSDTMIAAAQIGRVSLGAVATDNGGAPFGVVADRIASISATGGSAGRFSARNLDDPGQSVTEGDFRLRVL